MKSKRASSSSVRFIIFREEGVWYGTCLEYNIVEAGSTPQEAMLLLFEAVAGYGVAARKLKAPQLLRQKPDPEYDALWRRLEASRAGRATGDVFTFGKMNTASSHKDAMISA